MAIFNNQIVEKSRDCTCFVRLSCGNINRISFIRFFTGTAVDI